MSKYLTANGWVCDLCATDDDESVAPVEAGFWCKGCNKVYWKGEWHGLRDARADGWISQEDRTWDMVRRIEKAIGNFDGYRHFNGFDRCAENSHALVEYYKNHGTLPPTTRDDLKGCLFFDVRAHRHACAEWSDEYLKFVETALAELKKMEV